MKGSNAAEMDVADDIARGRRKQRNHIIGVMKETNKLWKRGASEEKECN